VPVQKNSAVIPAAVIDVQGDGRWNSQHRIFCEQARNQDVDILFLGDSMLRMMYNSNAWSKYLQPYRCLNFAIGGDQTQHVLWRLQNGELDSVKAKCAVVWCGTNNSGNTAVEVCSEGMHAVITYVREKLDCFVLLLAIAPRGEQPNPYRSKMEKANLLIQQKINNQEKVDYLDVASQFLNKNGKISGSDLYDFLHPSQVGYEKILSILIKKIEAL
uniref:1-alkyl-2-acetylglycerophosphocholine esterase n=1 Tax=Ciona savignyi TaxID=51511 RepID=H2Z3K4_CIOSA